PGEPTPAPTARPTPTPIPTLPPGTSVTYYQDVAPIISSRCIQCHNPTGIAAGYALDTFAKAQTLAQSMKFATNARRMPPWGPNEDGSCENFKSSRYLSTLEIQKITAWADNGTPMGTVAPTPTPNPGQTLANPTISGTMAVPFNPVRSSGDDYQCFNLPVTVLDTGLTLTPNLFVTGFEVVPGNRKVLHHVIAWVTQPRADIDAVIAAKENEDAAPGWECLGSHGLPVNAETVALWAPGTDAITYPAGTGIAVSRDNTRLIIQAHYSTALLAPAESAVDQTGIRLKLGVDGLGTKIARWIPTGTQAINLAPGQPNVNVTTTNTLAGFLGLPAISVAGTIWGVYPHMHRRGTSITFTKPLVPACLMDVPRWDFNWQTAYFYQTPLQVNTSETFRVSCNYNTVGATQPVVYGENTDNEMCFVFLYATQN
ncbi:MAG: hypothetical protein ABL958_13900, partial [Bdellovibrionia bacterium]